MSPPKKTNRALIAALFVVAATFSARAEDVARIETTSEAHSVLSNATPDQIDLLPDSEPPKLLVARAANSAPVGEVGDGAATGHAPTGNPANGNSAATCQGVGACHARLGIGYHTHAPCVPFGMCMRTALGAQVAAGLAGQTVLYRYDFCDGLPGPGGEKTAVEQLNPHGERQLLKIVGWWGSLPEPRLLIQPSGNHKIDDQRRQTVILRMSQLWGTAIPPEAVVTAQPGLPGTSGTEAIIHYENLLRQTEEGPRPSAERGTYGGDNGTSLGTQSQSGQ